jgi:hypothetical protein
LPSRRRFAACSWLLLFSALPALAKPLPHADDGTGSQQLPSTTESPAPQSEVPDVPGLSTSLHGVNAGFTFAGVHDSITGWATLFTPAIGYSFNDVFSIDATIPIYMYRLAESRAAHPPPDALLVNQRGEPGDLILSGHAQFAPALFQYQVTGAVTAPSGDEAYGLTTGRVTFDVNNHFERTFGRITPILELGAGDSATLVNRIVNKPYTSLGPLSHFQLGLAVDLPKGISFETDAYEQLPIGDQKIYGISRRTHATIVTGHNAIEDNGFINALDIPINDHFNLSGYYSRSLRLSTDTVAFGITFVLRSTGESSLSTAPESSGGLFRQP